ncbi:S41 family peptidase [Ornithinibacillus halotolerans]|uniref:Tail specific protease domain-containing protein n=1 Tax=Ornithinibacillus halotolerans TaxID=1274357 RepID=A0A916W995_9BACI|nr:S41 family peptidase [Ornithinibacillus halotolerans]GGA78669.1 hypothetical protein GCM10008025_22720 [Ornithinibacillus halotolerans]
MKKKWIIISVCVIGLFIIGLLNPLGNEEVNVSETRSGNTIENHLDKQIEEIILSSERIDDLFLLGKIWGFLKYYHPKVASGDMDWDRELFNILTQVMQSHNDEERDDILVEWIVDLGAVEEGDNKSTSLREVKFEPELDWITNSNLDENLVTHLLNIKNAKRTGANHYVSLTNIGNPQFNEVPYDNLKYPNIEYQLLSLYRYWNIIEYYFPYKYLIDDDWDEVLKEFIPKFLHATNEQDYKLTVLEIIARVQDTHANIYEKHPVIEEFWGNHYSPFIVRFVENKLVVSDYYDDTLGEETGVAIGDVITKINNEPVEEIVEQKLKYIPASNYTTQLRDIARKLLRANDDVLNIEVNRDGRAVNVTIELYPPSELGITDYNPYQLNKDYFQLLDSNIAYIYAGSMENEYIPEVTSQINDTNGLIIDLRSYPAEFIVYTFGEYLLPQSKRFVKLSTGSIKEPGLFYMKETYMVGRENEDFYQGKVIILVNELTQSQAEFTAMAFRTAPDVTVIGSTTAGADGDVSLFSLPGGITTGISGIGIYYPDGTETQRVGIVPDITVTPTIEGIRENRDELLEKAVELIISN